MNKPQVTLYDTTLRDGTQGTGIAFSVLDKIRVAEKLDAFGVHYIEGGWPGSNPKDVEFFAEARKRTWKNAKIAAFGSTRRGNLKVEDQANGTTAISLNLSDIPAEIQNLLLEKMQQKHACTPDCCCMQGCKNVELLNGLVIITVNEQHAIDNVTVNLDGRAQDADSKEHTMAASAELQFAW